MPSLVNNYKANNFSSEERFKRQKINQNEEFIIKWDSENKIRLNPYAIEHFDQDHPHQLDWNEDHLQNFESEIVENSVMIDAMEPAQNFVNLKELDSHHAYPNLYESSDLKIHQESIEEFMNSKPQFHEIKEFNMIGNYSQLDSNMNLISNNNEWKVDSINFNEPRPLKTIDKIKIDHTDDGPFLKLPALSTSLIDQNLGLNI